MPDQKTLEVMKVQIREAEKNRDLLREELHLARQAGIPIEAQEKALEDLNRQIQQIKIVYKL